MKTRPLSRLLKYLQLNLKALLEIFFLELFFCPIFQWFNIRILILITASYDQCFQLTYISPLNQCVAKFKDPHVLTFAQFSNWMVYFYIFFGQRLND